MDTWIAFARGPAFRVASAVLVLGLAYRLTLTLAQLGFAWWRAGDRRLPFREVARATAKWLVPVDLFRRRPLYGLASVMLHVGVVVVPLFLIGHVSLLAGVLPRWWPTLPPQAADFLTVVALAAAGVVLAARHATATSRALTGGQEVAPLVLLLLVLLSGYLAGHPSRAFGDARDTALVHMLLGNLTLVLIPTTRLVHCLLFPFTRLVGELGWHNRADAGRRVAALLGKEGEAV